MVFMNYIKARARMNLKECNIFKEVVRYMGKLSFVLPTIVDDEQLEACTSFNS